MLGRELSLLRELGAGQHAVTVLVSDGLTELVVRGFPRADPAVGHELPVLDRIAPLWELVPRLVVHGHEEGYPVIVTTALPGSTPAPDLPLDAVAKQMASALARIHSLDGQGLREDHPAPAAGESAIAVQARNELKTLDLSERVLTHHDFWCGNAVWQGDVLTGVVDWSGARHAPRGLDIAWCRQDLILLGSTEAAQTFLGEYRRLSGLEVSDIAAWDVLAAAQAHPVVETWAPNYHGIGRLDITPGVLRQRLDRWIADISALKPSGGN
ncbi:aminoglycoside phosphotransferase [Arthrobacter sp. Edens01]|nr:aminoglycoside phosphotransferase [Arthrobacter sp. Edens01]